MPLRLKFLVCITFHLLQNSTNNFLQIDYVLNPYNRHDNDTYCHNHHCSLGCNCVSTRSSQYVFHFIFKNSTNNYLQRPLPLYHHQHTSGIGLSASGSICNTSQAPGFYSKQAWGEIYEVLLLAIRLYTQANIHLILWYLLCILSVLYNLFVYWLKSGVRLDSWRKNDRMMNWEFYD